MWYKGKEGKGAERNLMSQKIGYVQTNGPRREPALTLLPFLSPSEVWKEREGDGEGTAFSQHPSQDEKR